MCGGTSRSLPVSDASSGLSPRVRGNLLRGVQRAPLGRSIPACAGEPSCPRLYSTNARVYPRVCGGTIVATPLFDALIGLSPRVRGNPYRADQVVAAGRSIPACAGEPRHLGWVRPSIRVYPRVCGGTSHSQLLQRAPGGLSPRVRGNPVVFLAVAVMAGSIPACAGEPSCYISTPYIA